VILRRIGIEEKDGEILVKVEQEETYHTLDTHPHKTYSPTDTHAAHQGGRSERDGKIGWGRGKPAS
jgi:hypothetical protein